MKLLALFGVNPASWVTSFVTAMFHDALAAIGTAASNVFSALIGFMNTTTEPVFSSGWWTGTGASVFVRVLAVAGSLMFIGFAMSIVSSVLSRDHTIMAKAALHLPLAAIEMAALVTVTAALTSGSDQIASYIAGGGSKGLSAFATGTLVVAVSYGGVIGLLLAGFLIIAGLMVWAVLIVRTALIYVAVMAGPLIFASAIHPATRHVRKRYVEGGIALICSKIIMAIAFATGSAMLGGLNGNMNFSAAVGALMEAFAILLIAAFAPFIFIKLLIAAEALTIAEGIERRPMRAAMSGASGVYHAAGLKNLMGRVGSKGGGNHGGDGTDGDSGGDDPSGSPSSGGPSRWGKTNLARGIAAGRRAASRLGSLSGTPGPTGSDASEPPASHPHGDRTGATSEGNEAPAAEKRSPTPASRDGGGKATRPATSGTRTTRSPSAPTETTDKATTPRSTPDRQPTTAGSAIARGQQEQFALSLRDEEGNDATAPPATNVTAVHGEGAGPSVPVGGASRPDRATPNGAIAQRPPHPAPPRAVTSQRTNTADDRRDEVVAAAATGTSPHPTTRALHVVPTPNASAENGGT